MKVANRTSDIIDRWVQEVGKPDPRFLTGNHTNIDYDSRQLYSYGSHFPMARLIGDRATGWFLLNGDLYSVSTSQHQSATRWAVKRSGMKSLIVPFSAMRLAGIELDSIEWVDITPDTSERVVRTWDSWEKLPHHLKYRTRTTTDVRYRTEPCRMGPRGSLETYSFEGGKLIHRDIHENDYPGTDHFTPYTHYIYDQVRTEPGEDGLWRDERTVHHLGQAVFKARFQSGFTKVRHWNMAMDYDATRKANEDRDWNDPEFVTIKKRHYYTENQPVYDTAYFLSGYDENERGRTGQGLYFLAQLPADAEPVTVAEAYDCLKPAEVRVAEAEGRDVVRQGDVFAIESRLSPATLKAMGAERPGLSDDELAGLARMRKHHAAAVARNGEAVMDTLAGKDGTMFTDEPEVPERIPGMGKTENWVLGVNHTGTDVLVSPAGTTWARGTLKHKRISWTWQGVFAGLPEHKRVKLGDGKTWYHVVKNTVPMDADGTSRAWTIGGGVD
jgi:hypothetical protein